MPRNYTKGTPSYVTILHGASPLKYGYKCRLQKETNYTELGITKIASVTAALLQDFVLGCNVPKPNRATKREADVHGYESSFVSTAAIAEAKKKGWQIARSKKAVRPPTFSTLSQTVYVTLNGVKYAWQYAKTPAGLTIDLDAIGVKLATTTETGLVWGCEFPRPGRAQKDVTVDGAASIFETFYDPSKAPLPAGWYSGENGTYTLDALQSML